MITDFAVEDGKNRLYLDNLIAKMLLPNEKKRVITASISNDSVLLFPVDANVDVIISSLDSILMDLNKLKLTKEINGNGKKQESEGNGKQSGTTTI